MIMMTPQYRVYQKTITILEGCKIKIFNVISFMGKHTSRTEIDKTKFQNTNVGWSYFDL